MKTLCFFFLLTALVPANGSDTVRTDLKPMWLMEQQGAWLPHSGYGRVAYLPIAQCQGSKLVFSATSPFSLLINHRLFRAQSHYVSLPVDSLKRIVHEDGMITLISSAGVGSITNHALSIEPENRWRKKPSNTSSFLTIMALLLTGALVGLVRTNPAMASDYFSLGKTFSVRQIDETPTVRLSSAINLLYFSFTIFLLGMLIFLFRNGAAVWWLGFRISLFRAAQMVGVVGLVILLKIVWAQLLMRIFAFTEFRTFHIQDYLRLVLASTLFCSFVLFVLVTLGIDWRPWTRTLEYFLAIMQGVFVLMLYLKLMTRGAYTVFHLFSYLCLAEIIPLILLLKIYFS